MYRNTRFGEVMKGLPRGQFEKVVQRHQGDKHSKGFRCWDQLLAMVYGQLSGCRSLREVEAGFNSQSIHHYHLGSRSIKRSTLSDANAKRRCEVFGEVCGQLLQRAHGQVKRELTDLLYLIDSTPIPLKGLGYGWTESSCTPRSQGLKVHMTLAPDRDLPVDAEITAPNVNDVEMGRQIPLEAGATYVFDKGYCDYNWWYRFSQAKAVFVTRFKKNAGLRVEASQAGPLDKAGVILADEVVRFKTRHPGAKRLNEHYGTPLRRVVVARPDKLTPLVLATNDFERTGEAIAGLYKARWRIELFFKWLKQNLKIKQFYGRSENAVKIQIYTALITYLLVKFYGQSQGVGQTLKLLLVELRSSLFQRPAVEQEVWRRRQRWREEVHRIQRALPL